MRAITLGGILGLAALASAVGCGGSASPTSDFCQQSSAAMCHRAYTCTPSAMQDADFHNAWGPSEATCASGLAQLCDSACTGKAVDPTAKTQCFSDINTQACSTVTDGTLGNSCAAVCVDAPTGGGGNSGGAGGSSGGGTISDPIVFCQMSSNKICDRAFQCVPVAMQDADFISNYGASVAACKAMTSSTCVDPATHCPTYNATNGASCVAALTNNSCSDLLFLNAIFPPASCFSACGM